jgi:hypothetical protein
MEGNGMAQAEQADALTNAAFDDLAFHLPGHPDESVEVQETGDLDPVEQDVPRDLFQSSEPSQIFNRNNLLASLPESRFEYPFEHRFIPYRPDRPQRQSTHMSSFYTDGGL